MPAQRTASDSDRSTASAHVVEAVTTLVVLTGLAVWSLFWSNLVRLHYSQGDLASAVFTMVAFVAPAVGIAVWYVGQSLGIDAVSPNIDADVLSS